MRSTFAFLFLFLFLASAAVAADRPAGRVDWESDWDAAFARARAEKKLVFVDFFANWCAPCVEMDTSVFPQTDVKEQMNGLVLLRVNVDRKSVTARNEKIRVLPTYVIYDCAERERIRFSGSMPLPKFLAAMTEVRAATPLLVQAAELLDGGREADGWILIGNAYARLQMSPKAREAFGKAADAAKASNDAAVAKIASAQSAFTYGVEGKPGKAVKELTPIAATNVAPYADALAHLLLGRAAEKAKDARLARASFERAATVAPAGALQDQARSALANMQQ